MPSEHPRGSQLRMGLPPSQETHPGRWDASPPHEVPGTFPGDCTLPALSRTGCSLNTLLQDLAHPSPRWLRTVPS